MHPTGWLRRASVIWPRLPPSRYLEPGPDSYLTQVSNRLGMATKAPSVVATASSTFRFTLIRTAS